MRIDMVRLEVVCDRTVDYGKTLIKKPEDLAGLGFEILGKADREMFLLVCLSTGHNVNALHVVSVGSLNSSIVHPREVYKVAILTNSAAIAVMHNHPSGNIQPSREDKEITRKLLEAGEILGIKLVDHVIVGGGNFYSFASHGLCNSA